MCVCGGGGGWLVSVCVCPSQEKLVLGRVDGCCRSRWLRAKK